MDSKLISFIGASFTSLLWTSLPSVFFTVLLLIFACLLLTKYQRHYQYLGYFLLGIVWMASVGHWQYSLQLSSKQTSQPVQIIGTVKSVVIAKENIRFNVQVKQINEQVLFYSKTFRLSWREPNWQVQQGQQVKLLVKVKPPHGLGNEAGFNYQQWLFSKGIVATGYVKSHPDNHLISHKTSVRQSLLNRMLALDLPNRTWLAALTFGYRGLLQPEDWQLVQKTGVAHLIAISGLHLALVASLSYVLIAWVCGGLLSRIPRSHHFNLHNLAMVLTLGTTFTYSALAGFGLPTLRAWIMLLLFSVCFVCHIHLGVQRVILLGLSTFVLLFPLSIFGLSFWLSFFAVAMICFVFWRWPVTKNGFSLGAMLSGMLKVQICLTVLMLPLIAWQFSYISWVSPLVNIIAVPVVTMVLVPICLLAVIFLVIQPDWAYWLFYAADKTVNYGLRLLNLVLEWEAAYLDLAAMPALVWLAVFLFVLGCCLPAYWLRKKYLGVLLVPLLSYLFTEQHNSWQVDVLDVGQGVAVLISKNNHVIIYDVGAHYPSGFNMADSVLLPILQARGVSNVDIVFISHNDNDHAGSLGQLLKNISVSQILSNQDSCIKGLDIQWQGLTIQGVWPDNANHHSDNNGSCVIKVSDQYHSVLLPGDIDKSIEKQLVAFAPQTLQADILVAPHHGSNTSSSDAFIGTVKPEYVVFSQGFMNRWRFPRQEVIARYQANNAILFSTSHSGQVVFRMLYDLPDPIRVATYRQDIRPYWYANFPRK
ncbi:DNA internalization-related competence protein ComEC/Rec2 [uncultured Paraglaciecola sp.]|uniref:DNA internalization-related competence protein ComEC/Rec2 n=1 Tax=uncultured Paraglaciecola sp. TaxID=1765024 RepID=UPI0026275D54|nr:DNA internalization-related competence protein ComEC/Rec2 [uncultured Paraglaciecola sp.]